MNGWKPTLAPGDDHAASLSGRIARAVVEDIQRGRLRPGEALPGSRTLASALGVHRNTVLAAYASLRAEGWVETVSATATRVAATLPTHRARRFTRDGATRAGLADEPRFALSAGPPLRAWERVPRTIALYGGVPDLSLLPREALARELRRVLRDAAPRVLDYGSPYGTRVLRSALATMVRTLRGVPAREQNVLVTRGCQQALDLCARALLAPRDLVVVEALGYAPAWTALQSTGAELLALPVDRDGLDVDALESLCARRPVRAVYVTPHHQYPTGVSMAPARRLALLRLAKRARFAILEDDYDHEFHYEGHPLLPLASADVDGSVVYLGTLSKLLAPGLRMGFIVAPTPLIDVLAAHRAYVDRQGDFMTETALAALFEDGEVARHARRARLAYAERRDVFAAALRKHAGDAVRFDLPRGGMALWVESRTGRDAESLRAELRRRGVLVQSTGPLYFEPQRSAFLRLGYAAHPPSVLRDAARTLGAVLRA